MSLNRVEGVSYNKRPWWHGKGPFFMILTLSLIFSVAIQTVLRNEYQQKLDIQRAEVERMQLEVDNLQHQKEILEEALSRRIRQVNELLEEFEEMEEVLQWDARQMTITHYAPTDPNAIEGVCYSGDPTITASGATVEPGITVAAGKNIPFGTKVYIPGYGYREVQDRGGAIGPNNIDVAVTSRSEAFELGRVQQTVYVEVQ